jgi:hypothetical protein
MESPVALFSFLLVFGKTWGFHTIIFVFYIKDVWNSQILTRKGLSFNVSLNS